MLLLVQVFPLMIIVYYAQLFQAPTGNAGWMIEKATGCRSWTSQNVEHRSFQWTGSCSEGVAEGPGTLTVIQHGYSYATFKGTLLKGKAEGLGQIVWLDGDRFEGEFRNGVAHGFGHFYNDDGDYFEGEFVKGRRSGTGTYWYEPGSPLLKYVGDWKDDLENGSGTLFYRNGTQRSGTFNHGKLVPNED